MNEHPAPVLALDIPTGIHGDTGNIMGVAVKADLTVTFVGLKAGLFASDGAGHCGDLVLFAGLEVPERCRRNRNAALFRRIDSRVAQYRHCSGGPRTAHKGDFGHVLIVGGGPGMPGAVRLAGEAALRSGAGLVSVATHPRDTPTRWSARGPELMCACNR